MATMDTGTFGPITTQINQGIHLSGFMGGNQLPHAMPVSMAGGGWGEKSPMERRNWRCNEDFARFE